VDFTGDVERLKDSADHLPLLRLGWTASGTMARTKQWSAESVDFFLDVDTQRDLIVKAIEERIVLQGEYAKKGDELIKEKEHRGSVLHCVYRSTLRISRYVIINR